MTPRGLRNNNPGNIRRGEHWLGMKSKQTDPLFCQFNNIIYGYRAMAKLLLNYQLKYGLNTIESIINRWAPPTENNSRAYINAVAQYMAVKPKDIVCLTNQDTLINLMAAIAIHENGTTDIDNYALLRGAELALSSTPH